MLFTVNLSSFMNWYWRLCGLSCGFVVAVVGAPAGISQAVIRSLSSAIVGADEQGIDINSQFNERKRETQQK